MFAINHHASTGRAVLSAVALGSLGGTCWQKGRLVLFHFLDFTDFGLFSSFEVHVYPWQVGTIFNFVETFINYALGEPRASLVEIAAWETWHWEDVVNGWLCSFIQDFWFKTRFPNSHFLSSFLVMAYQKKDVSFEGNLHFKMKAGRPYPFLIPPSVAFPTKDADFEPYKITNFGVFRKVLMKYKKGQLLKICGDLDIATSQKPNKIELIDNIFGACFLPRSRRFDNTTINDMTTSRLDDLYKILLGKWNEKSLEMTPKELKDLEKKATSYIQKLREKGADKMLMNLSAEDFLLFVELREKLSAEELHRLCQMKMEEEEDIGEDEVFNILDALDLEEDDMMKDSMETFAEGYGGFTDATTVKVLNGAHGKVLFMVGGLDKATDTGRDLKKIIEEKMIKEMKQKNPEIENEYHELYDIYLYDGMRQVKDDVKLGFSLSSVSVGLKLKGGGLPVKKKEKLAVIDSKFREKKEKVANSLDSYIKKAQELRDDSAEDLVMSAIERADENTLNMMLQCYNEGSTHGGRFAHEFAKHVVPEIGEVEVQVANLQDACDMMKSAFEYKFSQEFMSDTGRFAIASILPKLFEDRAKEIEKEKKRNALMETEIEARVQQRLVDSMAKMTVNSEEVTDTNME